MYDMYDIPIIRESILYHVCMYVRAYPSNSQLSYIIYILSLKTVSNSLCIKALLIMYISFNFSYYHTFIIHYNPSYIH